MKLTSVTAKKQLGKESSTRRSSSRMRKEKGIVITSEIRHGFREKSTEKTKTGWIIENIAN